MQPLNEHATPNSSYLRPRAGESYMIQLVEIGKLPPLEKYEQLAQLTQAVRDLRSEAAFLAPRLEGRRVWMVSSTAQGGGVAEMLPRLVSMMNELGVSVRWAVIAPQRPDFFPLTKRLHNLIHGSTESELTEKDRALYEAVSQELADEFGPMLSTNDVVVVHDPQPAGMGALLRQRLGLPCIWRCHIGEESQTAQSRAAWRFLEPYLGCYDHFVFSAPEYIPNVLSKRTSIIFPAIDPFSHKNRELSTHKLVGILANSSLVPTPHPVLTEPFEQPAMRLQANGAFAPALLPEDIGLLYRPIVTQISRWDKLKGWPSLLEGFIALKRRVRVTERPERQHRALELVRLVLAGPEPAAVQDDPEATAVLAQLTEAYRALGPDLQRDIAILSLPMGSRKNNALMVNCLQRCSSVVVQNSLREGFGLTVAEAMWKRLAVVGSTACGIRHQIRHGVDGFLNSQPNEPSLVADALEFMLEDPQRRIDYAQSAQRRVQDEFLVFTQVAKWLRVLAEVAAPSHPSPALSNR